MPITKIHFDKMTIEDLNDVMLLEEANYPVPWSKGIMKDCIKAHYHCIVARLNQQIIGYAFLMTAFDESHLLNMCIDKTQQSQGIGRKLLKHLENICRLSHSKVFLLEVRESNPIAQSLYQSFGFEQIGMRKNYYRCIKGRENAIVMTKQLMT
ncbi:MAG: ribosomal protein S18-alanine N-acetyltransferase [Marinicellaceae bacterium]